MQDSNLSANLGSEQIWHIQIVDFTSVLVKMRYALLGQNSSVLFRRWHQEMLFKDGFVTISIPLYSLKSLQGLSRHPCLFPLSLN